MKELTFSRSTPPITRIHLESGSSIGSQLKNFFVSRYDQPLRRIHSAATAIAKGDLVIQGYYTPGVIANGLIPDVAGKLLEAKGIPAEEGWKGQRPLICVLPLPEYRKEIIDFDSQALDPKIGKILKDALLGDKEQIKQLLHPDGHPLFYILPANTANKSLVPPLVSKNGETGITTIAVLIHNNNNYYHLEEDARRELVERSRRGEINDPSYLLIGSSANPTHKAQPSRVRDVDPGVRQYVHETVRMQDWSVYTVPFKNRGAIPMIRLVGENAPSIERPKKGEPSMYEPIPKNQYLAEILRPQYQAIVAR